MRAIAQILSISLVLTVLSLCFVRVPHGLFGIAIEKTAGFTPPILEPGMHFFPSGFVPEKWKFILLSKEPQVHQVSYSQNLRYTEFLELGELFRLRFSIRLTTRYKPEKAKKILEITKASEDQFRLLLQNRIGRVLEKKFLNMYTADNLALLSNAIYEYFNDEQGFASDLPQIYGKKEADHFFEIMEWEVLDLYIPDETTYRYHLQYLPDVVGARKEALVNNILEQSKIQNKRLANDAAEEHVENLGNVISRNKNAAEVLKWQAIKAKKNLSLSLKEGQINLKSNDDAENDKEESFVNDSDIGILAPLQRAQ